ncbi:hypothetical protein HZI56_05585 [Lactobacillus salivarius]|nr:hypothetical protein [Ligilactobacillus salivarius]NYA58474.1 hypothetical protein [Ligilactobacillus salivarius]NYA66632.1 hypothetical protein [Ligilactobacillus salivarius]NYA68321.1 hypothetical protein [Ligilactobacillus salivarius]NYA73105.1 hypothetical protein [Ligilactobacillus salivarius]
MLDMFLEEETIFFIRGGKKINFLNGFAASAVATKLKLGTLSMFFAAGDPFGSAKGLFDGLTGKFKLVATAVFVLVLVVTGIAYSFGDQELKTGSKKKWIDVGLALCVVFGATAAVLWLQSFLAQQGWS